MHNHEPAGYKCPFCALVRGEETDLNAQDDVVLSNDKALAFVSPRWWRPVEGNVLVIPREHFENIYDLPADLVSEIACMGKTIAIAMREAYDCDGVSLYQHNEPAGEQVVWHYHLHVFPRRDNDELHLTEKNSRYVSLDERKPYAEKLRRQLDLKS